MVTSNSLSVKETVEQVKIILPPLFTSLPYGRNVLTEGCPVLWFNKAGYLVKVVGQLISEVKDERISKAKALFRAI